MRMEWMVLIALGRLLPLIGLAFLLHHQRERQTRYNAEDLPDYLKYRGRGTRSGAMEIPYAMLVLPLAFALWCGVQNSLEALAHFTVSLAAQLSIYYLLLVVMLPWVRKVVSARTCATLWVLPSLLYWMVHYLDQAYPSMPRFVLYISPVVWRIAGVVWAVGALTVLAYYLLQHRRFRRELQAGELLPDEATQQLWEAALDEAGLLGETPIPLRICPGLATPLVVGSRRSTMRAYLPAVSYGEEELRLVFRHELGHISRGDGETKLFWCFCRAFCWFNPLIWIAAQKALEDLELACDELVLRDADQQTRYAYARLLLETAGDARGISTCLSSAAQTLRHRLKSVTAPRKVRRGTALLFAVMIVLCLTQGQIAFSTRRSSLGSLTDLGNVILANDPAAATAWLEELQVLEMSTLYEMNQYDGYVAEWYGSLSIKDGEGRSGTVFFNDHWVSVSRYDADAWNATTETYRLARPLDREILEGFLK